VSPLSDLNSTISPWLTGTNPPFVILGSAEKPLLEGFWVSGIGIKSGGVLRERAEADCYSGALAGPDKRKKHSSW